MWTFAQSDTLHQLNKEQREFSILLKFHPLAALNIDRPSIQGSVEFKYRKLSLELGYGQRYLDHDWRRVKTDTVTTNFKGRNYRIDIKYYIWSGKKVNRSGKILLNGYIGLAYWNINDIFNFQADYSSNASASDGFSLRDCYAVKRNIEVYSVQVGSIFSKKRIGAEACIGIGIRHKVKTLIDSELNNNTSVANPGDGDLPYNGYLPHLNLCLKIQYRLF
jgi:hypothetical protein